MSGIRRGAWGWKRFYREEQADRARGVESVLKSGDWQTLLTVTMDKGVSREECFHFFQYVIRRLETGLLPRRKLRWAAVAARSAKINAREAWHIHAAVGQMVGSPLTIPKIPAMLAAEKGMKSIDLTPWRPSGDWNHPGYVSAHIARDEDATDYYSEGLGRTL